WLSGRKRRFAKPLYGLNRTGGSNPPLSARNRNSGKKPNGSTTGHPSRDRPHEVLQLLDAMLAGNGKAEIAAGFPARITNETGENSPREQLLGQPLRTACLAWNHGNDRTGCVGNAESAPAQLGFDVTNVLDQTPAQGLV